MKGVNIVNNTTIGVLTFAAGAAIGAAATWIFAKNKYEKIIDKEVESVKETYAKRYADDTETSNTEETVTEESIVETDDEGYEEYNNLCQSYVSSDQAGDSESVSDKPYVISPEEFGEREGYDQFSLTYYADSYLTDENDCLIEDVESIIGFESLTHFGEYEDDSVFVRNDRLKCDYEILLDQRRYADVLKTKPYLVEDE